MKPLLCHIETIDIPYWNHWFTLLWWLSVLRMIFLSSASFILVSWLETLEQTILKQTHSLIYTFVWLSVLRMIFFSSVIYFGVMIRWYWNKQYWNKHTHWITLLWWPSVPRRISSCGGSWGRPGQSRSCGPKFFLDLIYFYFIDTLLEVLLSTETFIWPKKRRKIVVDLY